MVATEGNVRSGVEVATITASLIVPFYWKWPQNWIDSLLFIAMGAVGAGGHMLLVRAW